MCIRCRELVLRAECCGFKSHLRQPSILKRAASIHSLIVLCACSGHVCDDVVCLETTVVHSASDEVFLNAFH